MVGDVGIMMRVVRWALLLLLGSVYLFGVAGCRVKSEAQSAMDNGELEYLRVLEWVKFNDAGRDSEAAIARQDYRLLVLAGRGETVPGIDPQDSKGLVVRCGKRYLAGSTDVIRNPRHGKLLQQAYDYAAIYNRLVAAACPL